MKIDHLCGGHIYLISNFGVARNPIFHQQGDVEFFRSNVEKYLSKLCDIYAYDFTHNQFQILIRVKWRNVIEDFFILKHNGASNSKYSHLISEWKKTRSTEQFPETYKIFSQEVSNMLNSYAKYFNFKYKRKGGLFGSRYSKILVEGEEELKEWVKRLNEREPLVLFERNWRAEEVCKMGNEHGEGSSKVFYEERVKDEFRTIFSNFWHYFREDLRGCFWSLPPSNLKKQDVAIFELNFIKKNGYFPPW